MKNMKNKIGSLFLVSILAIAGVGISFAGFYDEIYVDGYVTTATVTLDLIDYSCTDVWKVWMDNPLEVPDAPYDNEVFEWHGWCGDNPTEAEVLAETGADNAQLYSWAAAYPSQAADDYVFVDFINLFPCIDFVADFVFHYSGSIPAKIAEPEIIFTAGFPPELEQYVVVQFYEYNIDTGAIGPELLWPVQVHFCDYIYVKITIHLAQLNELQGLSGYFYFNIKAIQWYDSCLPPIE